MNAHKLTLDKTRHSSANSTLNGTVTFWSRCSCGWWGDAYSTCPDLSAFYSLSEDECETAAVEQGSDHKAYLS